MAQTIPTPNEILSMAMTNLKLKSVNVMNPKAKIQHKQMMDFEKSIVIAFFYFFRLIQAVANLIA